MGDAEGNDESLTGVELDGAVLEIEHSRVSQLRVRRPLLRLRLVSRRAK